MDQSLFRKYSIQIQKAKESKDIIIGLLQKITGITLQQEEISISKKTIHIQTSSVKRSCLQQKNVKELLKEKGYTLTF